MDRNCTEKNKHLQGQGNILDWRNRVRKTKAAAMPPKQTNQSKIDKPL